MTTHRVRATAATLLASLETDRGGVLVTDPPWDLRGSGRFDACASYPREGVQPIVDTLTDAQRVLQPGAHAYVFTPAGPEHYQIRDALAETGWLTQRTLIWYKGTAAGLGAYRNAYEPVLVLSNGPPRPYPGPNASYPSLLAYPAPPGRTRKPWQLYARFLEMSSTADELAIDPYAGADPLAKAAGRMNRGQPTISGDLYTPQQVADDLANRTWRDAGRPGDNENHDRETGTHVQDRLDVRP